MLHFFSESASLQELVDLTGKAQTISRWAWVKFYV
jgi:hypothetical protein